MAGAARAEALGRARRGPASSARGGAVGFRPRDCGKCVSINRAVQRGREAGGAEWAAAEIYVWVSRCPNGISGAVCLRTRGAINRYTRDVPHDDRAYPARHVTPRQSSLRTAYVGLSQLTFQ